MFENFIQKMKESYFEEVKKEIDKYGTIEDDLIELRENEERSCNED